MIERSVATLDVAPVDTPGRERPTRIVLESDRRDFRWFWILLTLVMVAVFLPTSIGGRSTILQVGGQSMEPTYATGDLVFLRTAASYDVGDVVGYQVPPSQPAAGLVVVHRIVGHAADGTLLLQGDNNATLDSWVITEDDVLGTASFHLPGGGHVLSSIWLMAAVVAAFIARLVFVLAAPAPQVVVRTNDANVAAAMERRRRIQA